MSKPEDQQENLADLTGQWYAGVFADKPQNLLQAGGRGQNYKGCPRQTEGRCLAQASQEVRNKKRLCNP